MKCQYCKKGLDRIGYVASARRGRIMKLWCIFCGIEFRKGE
jgi:hypothetical protein